jgi:hypothetical protein
MTLTGDRFRDGSHALRMTSPTWPEGLRPATGRPPGETAMRFRVAGQDWSDWNRLSVWVYPTAPGHKHISFLVKFFNDGAETLPGSYTRGALHYVLLRDREWNHVVFEIPHLTRDRVTAVEFIYRLQGGEPGAARTVQLDLDRLELQKVDADAFEGWAVAPDRLALCHLGYPGDSVKTAIASGLEAGEFRVLRVAADGSETPVLTRPVAPVTTRLGRFQVLNFTEVRQPGTYRLAAGTLRSPAFPVGPDVWRESVVKTLNFFRTQRCGCAVPGVHDVCHQDWRAVHGDRSVVINGGWHDAGDLSQGLTNTSEATYALFDLAGALTTSDPALSRRLMEEATWGLDWVLKTRFGDGYRVTWATMDYWTDNQAGTSDDTTVRAVRSPVENAQAAAAEAIAARVLKPTDPACAAEALRAARDDWQHGPDPKVTHEVETASYAVLAAVELFRATGELRFADQAVAFADTVLDCQQRRFTDWSTPMAGFYYTSTRRDHILHYFHRGHEQAPTVALAELCAALPAHPKWMAWYAAVVLHGEYLRRLAEFTAPFDMMPASVYRLGEGDRNQILRGIPMDADHYLRLFPVWGDFRGNSGTGLSQAKALSATARLRGGTPGLVECCRRQLEWTLGCNPFGQSLMYGAGYDYAPQYTACSGDLVGSLPVGIQSLRDHDQPYWPAATCYNYKEVWVHPSLRWLSVQRDLVEIERTRASRSGPPLFISDVRDAGGRVKVSVTVYGQGLTRVVARAENLQIADPERAIQLERDRPRPLSFPAVVVDPGRPWLMALEIPGDPGSRRDVVGGYPAGKR